MENQQNKNIEDALSDLRKEIDEMDNQLISLLGKRMQIVDQVGKLKENNSEKFFIRSNREADMIKNLVNRCDTRFPKSSIVGIWRKIIAAANMHEQKLEVAIHNPNKTADYEHLIKDYYNHEMPISSHDKSLDIISCLEKGESQIGGFSLSQKSANPDDKWWINLAKSNSDIKIFAKLPFVKLSDVKGIHENSDNLNKDLVIAAITKVEKSLEDNSFIYIEVSEETSEEALIKTLENADLTPKLLDSSRVDDKKAYFFEVGGFHEENSQQIADFRKSAINPELRILGYYALPILI